MAEERVSLSWDDDYSDLDEELSEEAIKKAEAMGKVPAGKYLCECTESKLQQYDGEYSCLEVNLRWEILKVLELNGIAIKKDEGEGYKGRIIFDTVKLYSPNEKENTGNRRVLVAKRIGLIANDTKNFSVKLWEKAVSKKAILTYIDNEWIPKGKTIPVKKRQVGFDGYESVDGMEITDQTPDIDDI